VLNFPDNEHLVEEAPPSTEAFWRSEIAARKLAFLLSIYVNDNREKWRSDFRGYCALLQTEFGGMDARKTADTRAR
jgi:hypothetical protein